MRLIPKNGDTQMTADMECTVLRKVLGRLANCLIIARIIVRSLAHPLKSLKLLHEDGSE